MIRVFQTASDAVQDKEVESELNLTGILCFNLDFLVCRVNYS